MPRNVDKSDIANVEITPEMIEAGEVALTEYEPLFEGRDVAVVRIFTRMVQAAGGRVRMRTEQLV